MQNKRIQRRPSYAIESVDNALRLLQMLRDEDAIRVRDAAQELGVATSTAHRLLSMLVYRGFAVQDESRRYLPGLAIGASPVSSSWMSKLRVRALPHLRQLRDETGETTHLAVRFADKVRFLETVESRASLRVGDLRGAVLQAHRTAAGLTMLSELPDEQIAKMFSSPATRLGTHLAKAEFSNLMLKIDETRRNGYAINRGLAEEGVGSIAFSLSLPAGVTSAAITIASPLTRLNSLITASSIEVCHANIERINYEIRKMRTAAE